VKRRQLIKALKNVVGVKIMDNIIFLFLGGFCGILTGLLPGIHPNTLIPLSFVFLPFMGNNNFASFLIGMVITHYYINYIPSAFIGAPDDETAVSVVPLHNLTKKGKGFEGIFLCGLGGFIGILLSFVVLLIIISLNVDINQLFILFKPFIPYILILLVLLTVFFSDNKFWSIVIIILSSLLGYTVLYLKPPLENILTPLFTGLFAVPLLIENLKTNKICNQIITYPNINLSIIKSTIVGVIGGFFRIFLPAIGGAQINFFLGKLINEEDIENFLTSQGSIVMSNEVFSLLALLLIGTGRSGVAMTIKNLNINLDLTFIFQILLISIFGFIMLILLSKILLNIISKINYCIISIFLLIFCLIVVILLGYFSGHMFFFLLVFIVSIIIGMLCVKTKTNMSYLMCVLVLPTVLYYLIR